MEMMEIILLAAGGIIFVLSFLIPEKKSTADALGPSAEKEVRELVSKELESMRGYVDEVVEESVAETMEKTERSLEKLSNEKIMAVNEYSDTVLAQIHKDHEEAVFLYDMLNNKHTSLKNIAAEVNTTVKEAKAVVGSLQQLTQETSAKDAVFPKDPSPWEPTEMPFVQIAKEGGRMVPGESAAEGLPEESGLEASNNEKILKLYKKGKSAVTIAKELELGIGEVRLVIDLYRKQSQH